MIVPNKVNHNALWLLMNVNELISYNYFGNYHEYNQVH